MREVLYRGKHVIDGEWVKGIYFPFKRPRQSRAFVRWENMWIITPDGSTMVNTDNCDAIIVQNDGGGYFRICAIIGGSMEHDIPLTRYTDYEYVIPEMENIMAALKSGQTTYTLTNENSCKW